MTLQCRPDKTNKQTTPESFFFISHPMKVFLDWTAAPSIMIFAHLLSPWLFSLQAFPKGLESTLAAGTF